MKTTLLLIAIATSLVGGNLSASTQSGWGQKQTQGTVKGAILGGTLGGIVGHQHDKQKEGIIIGSVLGMIIGNQGGKGSDARNEQQRWEEQKRQMAYEEQMRRREQQRREQEYRYRQSSVNTSFGNNNDELTRARHRAEQREAELHRELEIRRIQENRRRALLDFQERERRAQEQLKRIRNGEQVDLHTQTNTRYNPLY